MEIKEIEPIKVIYRSIETSLRELDKYVGNTPAEIMQDAKNLGLEITGPQIWCYYGADGNPDTIIQLEIAVPVDKIMAEQPEKFKTLEPFKCASTILNGSWDQFKQCYENLIGEMYQNNLFSN